MAYDKLFSLAESPGSRKLKRGDWLVVMADDPIPPLNTWSLVHKSRAPDGDVQVLESSKGLGDEALAMSLRSHSVRHVLMSEADFEQLKPKFDQPLIKVGLTQIYRRGAQAESGC